MELVDKFYHCFLVANLCPCKNENLVANYYKTTDSTLTNKFSSWMTISAIIPLINYH